MNLDEWIWRNKIKKLHFAAKLGITPTSLKYYIMKERTPILTTALNIQYLTNGEVTLQDLIAPKSKGELIFVEEVIYKDKEM